MIGAIDPWSTPDFLEAQTMETIYSPTLYAPPVSSYGVNPLSDAKGIMQLAKKNEGLIYIGIATIVGLALLKG